MFNQFQVSIATIHLMKTHTKKRRFGGFLRGNRVRILAKMS